MTRAFARPLAVAALVAVLTVLIIPSAGASPLFASQPDASSGWFSSAWAWLTSFLNLNPTPRVPQTPSAATVPIELARETGSTGVCIDPLGNPYPCSQWLIRPPSLSTPGEIPVTRPQ